MKDEGYKGFWLQTDEQMNRQDPRLQGQAPGFRQRQDRDKTGSR